MISIIYWQLSRRKVAIITSIEFGFRKSLHACTPLLLPIRHAGQRDDEVMIECLRAWFHMSFGIILPESPVKRTRNTKEIT